jgi:HAE1 family hydrophobic/amphiphilic exporter-1
MSIVGGNARSPLNNGTMFVELKDKKDRPPLDQTLRELRASISKIPGMQAFITPQQSLRFGGRQTASQYQLVVQALSADQTNLWANKIQQAMHGDPRFTDVTSDAQNNALQANIRRRYREGCGLWHNDDQLRTTLQESFGGYAAAQIQSTGDSYDVIVEYDTSKPWDDQKLQEIRVASASGALVPLSNFARFSAQQALSRSTRRASWSRPRCRSTCRPAKRSAMRRPRSTRSRRTSTCRRTSSRPMAVRRRSSNSRRATRRC